MACEKYFPRDRLPPFLYALVAALWLCVIYGCYNRRHVCIFSGNYAGGSTRHLPGAMPAAGRRAEGMSLTDTAPSASVAPSPGVGALFVGFLGIGVIGFGGVMPWARRMVVEQRRWLGAGEFTDLLALCQFLPGPNIVNMAVAIGARYRGAAGSVAAVAGLLAAPMVI